jgi:hypothetical protein
LLSIYKRRRRRLIRRKEKEKNQEREKEKGVGFTDGGKESGKEKDGSNAYKNKIIFLGKTVNYNF